jgi:hypothetical protein
MVPEAATFVCLGQKCHKRESCSPWVLKLGPSALTGSAHFGPDPFPMLRQNGYEIAQQCTLQASLAPASSELV